MTSHCLVLGRGGKPSECGGQAWFLKSFVGQRLSVAPPAGASRPVTASTRTRNVRVRANRGIVCIANPTADHGRPSSTAARSRCGQPQRQPDLLHCLNRGYTLRRLTQPARGRQLTCLRQRRPCHADRAARTDTRPCSRQSTRRGVRPKNWSGLIPTAGSPPAAAPTRETCCQLKGVVRSASYSCILRPTPFAAAARRG
jgi:hypothetical protein